LTAVTGVINDLQTQVGASFFAFDSGATSATTHTITHNLNFRWPIVQLIDPTTNQIITADSVEFTTANELVVTLATAATLRASISWLNTTP
jgi:acetamidase/formamidase